MCYFLSLSLVSLITFWILARNHFICFRQQSSYQNSNSKRDKQRNYRNYKSLHLLFTCNRWPVDWKTPSGYLVAWFGTFMGTAAGMSGFLPFLSYFFASCWFFYFIADDLAKDLSTFNSFATTNTSTATNLPNSRSRVKLTNRFLAIIMIYSDARQYAPKYMHVINFIAPYFYFDAYRFAHFVCVSDVSLNSTPFTNIYCFHIFHGRF